MSEMIQTEPLNSTMVRIAQKWAGLGAAVIDFHKVDLRVGRGILEGNDRCMWTTDGRRITVGIGVGPTIVISQGKDVDPVYAKLVSALEEGNRE